MHIQLRSSHNQFWFSIGDSIIMCPSQKLQQPSQNAFYPVSIILQNGIAIYLHTCEKTIKNKHVSPLISLFFTPNI